MDPVRRIASAVDRFQRQHVWAAFPFAVAKKFGDDRAGHLAALIAYYAFLSLFPLLLVLVTVLGILMGSDPGLRARILHSAVSQFPIVGPRLEESVQGLRGSLPVLVLGILVGLWSGMAVVGAAQRAMNDIWDVPRARHPGFLRGRLRSLTMLVAGGIGALGTGLLAGAVTSTGMAWPLRLAALIGSVIVNALLFVVAFRILTVAELSWRDVAPGALVAAVAWGLLQLIGGFLVQRQVRGASEVYGVFAIVLGLLAWLYLASQVTLVAAEVNVVAVHRLWPRSLAPPPLSDPDRRSIARQAEEQEMLPEQAVEVQFDDSDVRGGAVRSVSARGAGKDREYPRMKERPAPISRSVRPNLADAPEEGR